MAGSAPWRVGRWSDGQYGDLPWYACDRGGWFGHGYPGRSFGTWSEAMDYAVRMVRLLSSDYWYGGAVTGD